MNAPTTPVIVLGLVSLAWIALLTRIFFLPGRWNTQWWLNTAPFAIGGAAMLGVLTGHLTPMVDPAGWAALALASVGAVLIAAGLTLGGCALGTHRRRLALWHQNDDAPEHLVDQGPYARIRHPFYTSYLVSLAGCVLAAPHAITISVFLVVLYRLDRTAAREERRFLASEALAERYRRYVGRTGRFLPRAPKRPRSGAGRAPAILVLVLSLATSGCMHWTPSPLPPRTTIEERAPDRVRLYMHGGGELVLSEPRIRNDSIVGRSDSGGRSQTVVSLADVRTLEIRTLDDRRVLWAAGVVVGAILVAVVLDEACDQPAPRPEICRR